MTSSYDASFWNDRYGAAGEGYIYGTEPNEFLATVANRIPPGPVLCLADGEGRNGVHLAALGHAVTAVDLSAAGLAKARALATRRGVPLNTVVADLNDFVIGERPRKGSGRERGQAADIDVKVFHSLSADESCRR